jgi:polyhydroxyalkanoate synthesis regulator phasin
VDGSGKSGGADAQKGVSDSLREAVERTFAATTEAGERAQELLDEVTRRGRDARESVSQRGQGARDAISQRGQGAQEASAGAAAKLVEAIEGMRLATRDELRLLEKQVAELSDRVRALESESKVEG